MSGTPAQNGVIAGYMAMGMSRKKVWLMRVDGERIPGEFEDAGNLAEGLIPVRLGGEWGYVDVQVQAGDSPPLALGRRLLGGAGGRQD